MKEIGLDDDGDVCVWIVLLRLDGEKGRGWSSNKNKMLHAIPRICMQQHVTATQKMQQHVIAIIASHLFLKKPYKTLVI